VEVLGLGPDLEVSEIDPEDVRVIFFGPVLTLEALLEADIRVTVDLFDLEEGIYSVVPEVEYPEQRGIELRSVEPSVITVEITQAQEITETLAITETALLPQNMSGLTSAVNPHHVSPVAYPPSFAYYPSFAYFARREPT
jgi:YbbR domain-containing protein